MDRLVFSTRILTVHSYVQSKLKTKFLLTVYLSNLLKYLTHPVFTGLNEYVYREKKKMNLSGFIYNCYSLKFNNSSSETVSITLWNTLYQKFYSSINLNGKGRKQTDNKRSIIWPFLTN